MLLPGAGTGQGASAAHAESTESAQAHAEPDHVEEPPEEGEEGPATSLEQHKGASAEGGAPHVPGSDPLQQEAAEEPSLVNEEPALEELQAQEPENAAKDAKRKAAAAAPGGRRGRKKAVKLRDEAAAEQVSPFECIHLCISLHVVRAHWRYGFNSC